MDRGFDYESDGYNRHIFGMSIPYFHIPYLGKLRLISYFRVHIARNSKKAKRN
jgi:hypothetical protein